MFSRLPSVLILPTSTWLFPVCLNQCIESEDRLGSCFDLFGILLISFHLANGNLVCLDTARLHHQAPHSFKTGRLEDHEGLMLWYGNSSKDSFNIQLFRHFISLSPCLSLFKPLSDNRVGMRTEIWWMFSYDNKIHNRSPPTPLLFLQDQNTDGMISESLSATKLLQRRVSTPIQIRAPHLLLSVQIFFML